jgi:hypothetical protein
MSRYIGAEPNIRLGCTRSILFLCGEFWLLMETSHYRVRQKLVLEYPLMLLEYSVFGDSPFQLGRNFALYSECLGHECIEAEKD